MDPADAVKPERQSFWLWVMCLTGLNYFGTLAYQPSIAFEAVGLLAPLATIVLVALTLFGALPVLRRVAKKSPLGRGSFGLFERHLGGWKAKLVVLAMLGFAATNLVVTNTLSAADAAEHLIHNPLWENAAPAALRNQMFLTMALLVLLGALFLRGFRETIVAAVAVVGTYLLLNLIIILSGLWHLATHPDVIAAWYENVVAGRWYFEQASVAGEGVLSIVLACLLFFPKLAVGLSGLETGIALMPLVRGEPDDNPKKPAGRIRNSRRLLTTAALIMSFMLLGSSVVTSMLIRHEALISGGPATNRALAFVAHGETVVLLNPIFGAAFGTIYDASTVAILWLAGASAMSALLRLAPRCLPTFGMAPHWAGTTRILVLVFTGFNVFVTWIFGASVAAQAGAYATAVLVLIGSDCLAVTLVDWKRRRGPWYIRLSWRYLVIASIFFSAAIAVIIESPESVLIAGAVILAILVFSMISRTRRSTESDCLTRA